MTPYVSAAAEASAQVSASGTSGTLRSVSVLNVSAATRYVYVFSGTSSGGTLIAGPFAVAAGAGVSVDFGDREDPRRTTHKVLGRFTNGCFIASSTSGSSFAAGGSDFRMNVEFG